MLDNREYQRWIRSARYTLESARRDYRAGDYVWACFKSHQAAEKAVKALLWGIGSPKIGHSITRLLKHLQALGLDVPENIYEEAMVLDKYYIPTRYPDVWSEGVPEEYFFRREAEKALSYANDIVEWVEGLWRRLLSRRD